MLRYGICFGTFPLRDSSYQHFVTSVIALAIVFIAQWGPGLRAEIFTAFGYIRNCSIKLILANLELLETAKITYLEIGLVVNFFQKNIEEKRRRFTFLTRQIIYSCFRTIYNNNSSYLFFEMMIETSQTELNLKISRS